MKNQVLVKASLIGALVIVPLLQGCYRTEAPPDPRTAAQKAEADWMNRKAVDLKGNFDALSPEDKQRVITFRNGNERDARFSFAMASHSQLK